MTTPRRPNRLADQTSPYLLQHANNPVDWYPWGPEALSRAEAEDKPILLSIGYAACHWCHVMERESFENEATARVMNENFVCIKVDREERPDLDDIYMAATIALSGGGGWPMTVFLTPEQAPFFAGTYFPPQDQAGRPGFVSLITRIAELWQRDRDQLFRQAGELTEYIRSQSELDPPQTITAETIPRAIAHLSRSFDPEWGGFGDAPKFPPCQALHLLMRHASKTGDDASLTMLHKTLQKMKDGGLYDQIGGGFARYSTDREWHVPHFEKMLYDNAQLARVYVEAYSLTKEPEYERIARETLDYVVREMQAPEGGYFSATDADSEGVEGKFFTFTTAELRAILEPEELRAFCAYYDVSPKGNWEGTNVLRVTQTQQQVSKGLGLDRDAFESLLGRARIKVFAARAERPAPLLDDKILVSWNGLMIAAMAEAGRVLGRDEYVASARRAADFIFERLVDDDGRLLRTARGSVAHLRAYLEDYSYLADGLVDLYEASGDPTALQRATGLCDVLLSDFLDPSTGSFFQTAANHERLLVRGRDGNDGALPNANAIAARALHRVGRHLDRAEFTLAASAALRAYGHRIERLPRAHLTSLNVLDEVLAQPIEMVFAGSWEQTQSLRREVASHYLPNRLIGHAAGDGDGNPTPLLTAKTTKDGKGALYVCRDYHCERPITSPADVAGLLKATTKDAQRTGATALSPPPLGGLATVEATTAFHDKHRTLPTSIAELWRGGPRVSKLGFGAYRVHEELPDHRQALLLAVTDGCNIIDTAPGYTAGSSERVIGDALAELVRRGQVTREQLVVVSKLGIVETRGEPLPEGAVELAASLGYCLTPAWLHEQLAGSLKRLNLEALDICLLHNPEMLLQAVPRGQAMEQIAGALRWLEDQRRAGRIGAYGISSNAWTLDTDPPDHVGPPRLSVAEIAQLVESNDLQGFRLAQTPLNAFELAALSDGVIDEGAKRGWGVITNRPLNALVNDDLWRLADAPTQPGAPALEEELQPLIALEREFRDRLGSVLEAVPDAQLRPGELLAWGKRIGPNEIASRAMWNEFERGLLARELPRVLAGLDQSFAGKQIGQVWFDFKRRYTDQLERLVVAARAAASEASNARNAPVKQALLETLEVPTESPTLAQLVLWVTRSLPGVSCTLTGMRNPGYVQQAMATMQWETPADAGAAINALRHATTR